MNHNDVLSKSLSREITKIELLSAQLQEQKDDIISKIQQELPHTIFIKLIDEIKENGYNEHKKLAKEIEEKEKISELEFEDYVNIVKIYNTIKPNIT